jgi:hypothetical protein
MTDLGVKGDGVEGVEKEVKQMESMLLNETIGAVHKALKIKADEINAEEAEKTLKAKVKPKSVSKLVQNLIDNLEALPDDLIIPNASWMPSRKGLALTICRWGGMFNLDQRVRCTLRVCV